MRIFIADQSIACSSSLSMRFHFSLNSSASSPSLIPNVLSHKLRYLLVISSQHQSFSSTVRFTCPLTQILLTGGISILYDLDLPIQQGGAQLALATELLSLGDCIISGPRLLRVKRSIMGG